MGTVGTLELPTLVSPCLRLFIEMLFEEVEVRHGVSWLQNLEVQSAIPKAIQKPTTHTPGVDFRVSRY
jgi:hypothetical protein